MQLAETLQAPVVDQGGRMNFPTTHYLSNPPAVIGRADVIIGMELSDYWGTGRKSIPKAPDPKSIPLLNQ